MGLTYPCTPHGPVSEAEYGYCSLSIYPVQGLLYTHDLVKKELLYPFYRWVNWGLEKLCQSSKVVQLLRRQHSSLMDSESSAWLDKPKILFCLAQMVRRLPAVRETWVRSLGWEDPLEKEMATHSSTLAWKIPWTEEPGRLQSMGHKELDTTERLQFHFDFLYLFSAIKRKK